MSGQTEGKELGIDSVIDAKAAATSGIANAAELIALAEAIVSRDEPALVDARQALRRAMGDEALVDAAAVAGNFQRMVRIADGCGIPLDTPLQMISADVREELGLDAFGASAHTPPPGLVARALGPLVRRFGAPLMRMAASLAPKPKTSSTQRKPSR